MSWFLCGTGVYVQLKQHQDALSEVVASSLPLTDDTIRFLETSPIRVAVFGEFSAGKTTLLNALIGEDILSVAVEPTTAVPTRIRYGREFNVTVELRDNSQLKLFFEDPPFWTRFIGRGSVLNTLKKEQGVIRGFLKQWTKEGERASDVHRVVIDLPLEWLKQGIELVDTPGVNNEYTRHHNFTEQEASESDLAILLVSGRFGGIKRTEIEFMNSVSQRVSKSFVVVNMMDCLEDEDERVEVLDSIKETIAARWGGPMQPPVFGISALARLHPEVVQTNAGGLDIAFTSLLKAIETAAMDERGRILLHRLGNPEQRLFTEARKFEDRNQHDRAHRIYHDLVDILQAANLELQPALDGIERCERVLKNRVAKLDEFHRQANEAFELEGMSPDEALEMLKHVASGLEELQIKDNEVLEGIQRLTVRVHNRDEVRIKVHALLACASTHYERQEYFEAGAISEKVDRQVTEGEYTDDELTLIRQRVNLWYCGRENEATALWGKWADEAWLHFESGRFDQMVNCIPELTRVVEFLPADAHKVLNRERADQFLNFLTIKSELLEQIGVDGCSLMDEWQAKLLNSFHLSDKLSEFYQRVEALTKLRVRLSEKSIEPCPRVSLESHCVSIEEKKDIADYLCRVLDCSTAFKAVNSFREAVEARRRHMPEIGNVWTNTSLLLDYPDHPLASLALGQILNQRPSLWTLPWRFRQRARTIGELENKWPGENRFTVLKGQFEEVAGANLTLFSFLLLAFLTTLTLSIKTATDEIVFAQRVNALESMNWEDQSFTAYEVLNKSWFSDDEISGIIDQHPDLPANLIRSGEEWSKTEFLRFIA